jgi:hypothetical protein
MLRRFAERLHEEVFASSYFGETSIFLCGKSLDADDSLRAKIAAEFRDTWSLGWSYNFVYPEDLFEELLSGPNHVDLLSLENVLADSVDAIVIIPESPGSFAELGAFANHEELRRKLICVQCREHKKAKSFINHGPVRMLRDFQAGRVVEIDTKDLRNAAFLIAEAVKEISSSLSRKRSLNAINADQFLLPSIYLLEPVAHTTLVSLVRDAAGRSEDDAAVIVAAGVSVLKRKGLIEIAPQGKRYSANDIVDTSSGFKLSSRGLEMVRGVGTRRHVYRRTSLANLDRLRVEVLTLQCRGKAMYL